MNPYDEYDEDFDWEDDPYEALREALSPEYRDLPPEQIEMLLAAAGLSAEDMEFNFRKALRSAGRFVQAAAPSVLPVAGTVLGTAFGGPLGGAIGGTLGRVAGGAIGGTGQPATPGRHPTPRAMTGMPVGGSPAAAQLLQLLNRPELLQSLLSMALGQAGRRQTTVGSTPVPPASITNLIGQLANQAAAEHNAAMDWEGEAVPAYLLDSHGHFLVDPAVPEQRAARLLELFSEAAWQETVWNEGWEEDEEGDDYDELDAYYDELEMIEADD